MNTEAYPLHWPQGYPRTPSSSRERARFKTTFAIAVNQIVNELRLLGASYPIISTNQPLRRDGLPSAVKTWSMDPGVAVYFLLKGKQRVLACDCWDRIEDNLRAVASTVEAMRGMDRWGVSQVMERSFEGFNALPPPQNPPRTWCEVLGVDARDSLASIEAVYRVRARRAHPDAGGSHAEMTALNQAIEQARSSKQQNN